MIDKLRIVASRTGIAVLVILLAAGTALAATSASLASARHDRSLPVQKTAESPEPSESPEASESPEPSENGDEDESAEASESPEAPESPEAQESPGASPSAANLDRIVARLAAAGITATSDELSALAAKVGVGGAVRVLNFAKASGKTPDEIVAMFEGGMGWGQIVRELKLEIGPGIGSIMGKGHAKSGDHAKGPKPGHGKP